MSYLRTSDVLQFGSVVCLLQLPRGSFGKAPEIGTSASRRSTVSLAVAMSLRRNTRPVVHDQIASFVLKRGKGIRFRRKSA